MTPNRRMVDPLLKCALEMWHALRTTPESHLLAEVIPSFPTDTTLPTWNANLQSHSVANGEAMDLWADAHHHPRGLMPERQWCAGAKISICKFLVVGDIGAADTCALDLDL
jgi:hypothetical protein